MKNLKAILEAAGTSIANALRADVMLSRKADGKRFNKAYAEFFQKEGVIPPT